MGSCATRFCFLVVFALGARLIISFVVTVLVTSPSARLRSRPPSPRRQPAWDCGVKVLILHQTKPGILPSDGKSLDGSGDTGTPDSLS